MVWFNEGLDMDMLEGIDNWLDQGKVVSFPLDTLNMYANSDRI